MLKGMVLSVTPNADAEAEAMTPPVHRHAGAPRGAATPRAQTSRSPARRPEGPAYLHTRNHLSGKRVHLSAGQSQLPQAYSLYRQRRNLFPDLPALETRQRALLFVQAATDAPRTCLAFFGQRSDA